MFPKGPSTRCLLNNSQLDTLPNPACRSPSDHNTRCGEPSANEFDHQRALRVDFLVRPTIRYPKPPPGFHFPRPPGRTFVSF